MMHQTRLYIVTTTTHQPRSAGFEAHVTCIYLSSLLD